MTQTDKPQGPLEPVLPLADIQGAAIPGFLKPHHTLLGVQIGDPGAFQKLLGELYVSIATGTEVLNDRRERRKLKAAKREAAKRAVAFVGIGFSFNGLARLTPGAVSIQSDAFRLGLAKRSPLLGDPEDPSAEGNPLNWKVGGPRNELDSLILIAGDTRQIVDQRATDIRKQVVASGSRIAYDESGDVRSDLPGHEHFGFDDGVSQPGIRGRASEAPDDFITDHDIAPDQTPETWLFGHPGQDLVWPGEFLLGQPATSPDPLIPGPLSPVSPEWTRNGAFLVFRRLRQDVGLFWRTMRSRAEELAKTEGFPGIDDEHLASLLVGRWPSGAPVNRTPEKDIPKLGGNIIANNHFRFESDSAQVRLADGQVDNFPMAEADPVGLKCPWAAHIRKVNTRDSGSDLGARDATYTRRVLRVGVPFGQPLKNKYASDEKDAEKGNRGLLFLSVQSSIEEQFEFLCSRWANDLARPKMPGGHDIIIGQNAGAGEQRERQCILFDKDLKSHAFKTQDEWVIATGGGYFFLPSRSALKVVLAGIR
jgi:Dyp-type peroxidase family